MDEIRMTWASDDSLRHIICDLLHDPRSHPHYTWVNNHLNRKGKIVVGHNPALHNKLIALYHDTAAGGHSGVVVTAQKVGSLFYWKKQQKHIRQFVRECSICQQNKHENVLTPGLLQPQPVPLAPFTDISMDFIEGLPKSEGKEVILVVVDRFSKYAHFMALIHPYSASSVARVFMDNVYKLHGLPATIVNDRDPVFLSHFWQQLFQHQGVNLHHSTAYHPQSNGQTEVVNRCLEYYLRCMSGGSPHQWSKWVPLAEWWYNTNYHTATKSTPYEILYGFPPPLHIPYFPKDSTVEAVDQLLTQREEMLGQIRDNLLKAQHRMMQIANRKRSDRQFNPGDLVYLKLQPYRQKSMARRSSQKLAAKFYDPFSILKKIGSVAYKLLLPPTASIHPIFHVSQLKKHIGNKIVQSTLPITPSVPMIIPQAILDRRMVKRGNQATTQILLHWKGLTPSDATWEFADDIKYRLPEFSLEDKVVFEEGIPVTCTT
jgi:hypothetical protein